MRSAQAHDASDVHTSQGHRDQAPAPRLHLGLHGAGTRRSDRTGGRGQCGSAEGADRVVWAEHVGTGLEACAKRAHTSSTGVVSSSRSREESRSREKFYKNRVQSFKSNLGLECGVGVARSTLNTPQKQRARGGHKREIIEAGEGLFARRCFAAQQDILDYAYMNGCVEKK